MARCIIDKKELRWACNELYLTLPIHVQFTKDDKYLGTYLTSNSPHRISISLLQSIDEANKSLWHELGHAQQCEWEYDGDTHLYNGKTFAWLILEGLIDLQGDFTYPEDPQWLKAYNSHPHEQHALDIEWRYCAIPLIRALS